MDIALPDRAPRGEHAPTALDRLGLAAQLTLVVTASVAAYTGLLPTSVRAVPNLDKVGHVLLIGGVGFFLDRVLRRRTLWAVPSLAAVAVLAVAGIEELAQKLSPRRTCDAWDFAADVAGVVFFVWLSWRRSR